MNNDLPELCPILPSHQFDQAALQHYLANKLPGIKESLDISQFQGGQSNPTFLLTTPAVSYVLRKKPTGTLLPSAHMVEREYKVLHALQGSGVPVPSTHLLCEDTAVIGTSFYVMEYVHGRIVAKPELPGFNAANRHSLYDNLAVTLASLHRIDWHAIGLADFGKPENYYERQIHRWGKQYKASIIEDDAPDCERAMQKLMQWLPANSPTDQRCTITHGDYRVGNMVIHPTKPKISAILDWELSTLGHPLGDLAYCCIPYHLQNGLEGLKGLKGIDLGEQGIPEEAAFMEIYCRQAGLEKIDQWPFFLAFSFFRLASILQGVYSRSFHGNANSTDARVVGARAGLMARTGCDIAGI